MPFDSKDFVEVKHAEKIAILDKMVELLAVPERWCKGASREGYTMCTIGAFNTAIFGSVRAFYKLNERESYLVNRVGYALMRNLPKGFISIMHFNDAPTTTHQDILDLIARTRKSFYDN